MKQLVIWTHSLEEFQLEVKISFLLILLSRHSSKRIYISIFFPIASFAYLSLLWTCCDVMVHAIHCDLVFISISSHPYNLPSTMQNMQCTFWAWYPRKDVTRFGRYIRHPMLCLVLKSLASNEGHFSLILYYFFIQWCMLQSNYMQIPRKLMGSQNFIKYF